MVRWLGRATSAIGGLSPRGPLGGTATTLGAAAVLAAVGVGFWAGAWWEHGRSTTPEPITVYVEVPIIRERVVAGPEVIHEVVKFVEVPVETIVEVEKIVTEVEYIRCVVRTITATLNSAGRQAVAESGLVLCPG